MRGRTLPYRKWVSGTIHLTEQFVQTVATDAAPDSCTFSLIEILTTTTQPILNLGRCFRIAPHNCIEINLDKPPIPTQNYMVDGLNYPEALCWDTTAQTHLRHSYILAKRHFYDSKLVIQRFLHPATNRVALQFSTMTIQLHVSASRHWLFATCDGH